MTPTAPLRGGIVLAGGRGTRMGRDKGSTPFRGSTLLAHVVTALAGVVQELVLVVRRDQALPPLPTLGVPLRLAFDAVEDLGPVGGLVAGLEALRAPVAYVSSCDAPLLRPAFVEAVLSALGDADVAIPDVGGRLHPLAAAWRRDTVLLVARAALAARRLRPVGLLDALRTVRIPEATLRAVDPTLCSLENLNTPDDLARAQR